MKFPYLDNSRLKNLRLHLWPVALLLVVTAAVYVRMLGHSFLNWDDTLYVTRNTSIQGLTWHNIRTVFSSYYVGNYAPIQMLSYMLDYTAWGLWPGGFLLNNLLVHTLNGLLVYRLLLKWHFDRLSAAIGAGLFLLHPVQVETVAWVSQRKTLLAMFFFLLAWEGYDRYRNSPAGKGRFAYAASITALLLALLAKSVAVIFPLVIILYDICFPVADRRLRLTDKIPYVLAAAGCAAISIHSQSPEFDGGRVPVGYFGGSPLGTFFVMLPVLCRYVGMLVWPVNLSAEYNFPLHPSFDITVFVSALLLIGLIFAGIRLYMYSQRLGFCFILFWIGILPVSQIIPLVTLINDRYFYFPMIGAAGLACAVASILQTQPVIIRLKLFYPMFIIPLLLLSILSFHRVSVWRNSTTLWSDAVIKSPNSSRSWGNLGEAYDSSVQWQSALTAYSRGLQLNPSNTEILYNCGYLYLSMGEYEKAHELLTKLLNFSPNHIRGLVALGNIHVYRLNFIEAERAYKRAYSLQPDSFEVLIKLGNLAVLEDRFDLARGYYDQAEAKGWNDPEVAYQILCVESLAGRVDVALVWLEKALLRGYRDNYKLLNNSELAPLWAEPQFNQLMRKYFP